jgi:4-hydroxythreonine-4-phosphate dehydrogenase
MLKRVLLTPGEPSGIGPDVVIQLAQLKWNAELVVIADPDLMYQRAKCLNLPLTLVETSAVPAGSYEAKAHLASPLKIIPIRLAETVVPGKLNINNARYVIETLQLAGELCLAKQAHALVTGPVQKHLLNQAGIPFQGHTEFFAMLAKVPKTVMLFVVETLKIALATTHLPLKKVAENITPVRLEETLLILHQGLKAFFGINQPKIQVCGLNPHAGENGYLGNEEQDIISPVLEKLNRLGYHIEGPYSADTIFIPEKINCFDATLAMYHDQALPLIKHIGFDKAVNITLGLPFLRTSVDHGTALELAGTGKANMGSMMAALKLALSLAHEG